MTKETCKYKNRNDGFVQTECQNIEHKSESKYPYCKHCGKKIWREEK